MMLGGGPWCVHFVTRNMIKKAILSAASLAAIAAYSGLMYQTLSEQNYSTGILSIQVKDSCLAISHQLTHFVD